MAYEKAIASFFPVAVVVECDAALFFPIFGWNLDGGDFAEPFENLAVRAFIFGRQGVSQRKFENILDSGQV